MHTISAAVLVLVLMVAAACGGSEQPKAKSRPTSSASGSSLIPTPAESSAPVNDPSVAEFGETIEFEDGLAVMISRPVRFNPSSGADYDGAPLPKRGVPVRFVVTVTNDGAAATENIFPLLTVTSEGEELQEVGISDPAYGIDGLVKDSRILTGKKAVSRMGYFVLNPRDVSIDIEIGGYNTLTFSNEGG